MRNLFTLKSRLFSGDAGQWLCVIIVNGIFDCLSLAAFTKLTGLISLLTPGLMISFAHAALFAVRAKVLSLGSIEAFQY